jgi:AAA+ ATPase superfamily predicted ATPase
MQRKFIGREAELDVLNKAYEKQQFQMPILWGRRRVGKSELLTEFSKNKNVIFFTGTQGTALDNLEQLAIVISDYIQSPIQLKFDTITEALTTIEDILTKNDTPTALIIDEYPYLATAIPSVSSLLQQKIDHVFKKMDHFTIILSGSSMSFMEKQVLGAKSPLYGRRTANIKLLPFTVRAARDFLPIMALEDYLTIYGITGGVPYYLNEFDDQLTLKENLLEHLINPDSVLYQEPSAYLQMEFDKPERYSDIIKAVATGSSRYNEISTKTQLQSGVIDTYLKNLLELGILERVLPLGEKSNKKATYHVKDGIFKFWYGVMAAKNQIILQRKFNLAYNMMTLDIIKFTSFVFEDFARQWLLEKNGTGSFKTIISEIGTWYGNNPNVREKQAEEIDILAFGLNKDEMLIGECKWRNEPTDSDVYNKLVERSEFFNKPVKELVIFSKSTFTQTLLDKANDHPNLHLINYPQMFD